MEIVTERLRLRPFRDDDLAAYAETGRDPEIVRHFSGPVSLEQSREKLKQFQAALAKDGFHYLAAEDRQSGEFVGVIGIARIDEQTRAVLRGQPEIEIGWLVARPAWGQGLAVEGARGALDYAWTELDAPEVVAFTSQHNAASRRVMEKLGMARDLDGDFVHPALADDDPNRHYVLYRIKNPKLRTS